MHEPNEAVEFLSIHNPTILPVLSKYRRDHDRLDLIHSRQGEGRCAIGQGGTSSQAE